MPRITRTEAERLTAQENNLMALGFTANEAEALRRISRTLRRWYELECGTDRGAIERNEATGRPYWCAEVGSPRTGFRIVQTPVADRERGALRRLGRIMGNRNTRIWAASSAPAVRDVAVHQYIQSDPRGACLYILRPGDVPTGADPASYYTRGVCVY